MSAQKPEMFWGTDYYRIMELLFNFHAYKLATFVNKVQKKHQDGSFF